MKCFGWRKCDCCFIDNEYMLIEKGFGSAGSKVIVDLMGKFFYDSEWNFFFGGVVG